jgi:hypothetical protein
MDTVIQFVTAGFVLTMLFSIYFLFIALFFSLFE